MSWLFSGLSLPRFSIKLNRRLVIGSATLTALALITFTALFTSSDGAQAGWFNDNWQYRQRIVITNNTTAETDVYIAFDGGAVLDTSDTDKYQGDCGDIRFTTQAGELLDYYINSGCGTASTDIDVLMPNLPADAQNIYMYYGNASVVNGTKASGFSTEATNYTIGTPATEEIGPGPVGYWKFDEGADNTCSGGTNDACDSSGNGNDGLFYNDVAWQTEDKCVSGKCIYLDGDNDYVDTFDFSMDYSGGGTFSLWFKPVTLDTGGYIKNIISKVSYEYMLTQRDDDIVVLHWNSSGGNTIYHTISDVLTSNAWYHLALVYNGTDEESYIYLNGEKISDLPNGQTNFINRTESMKIGTGYNWGSSPDPDFQGFVDEVKVYPYARTANEVRSDFLATSTNAGSSAVFGAQDQSYLSDGLVGYWAMDDNAVDVEGETSTDSSGNGNDGTLYGDNGVGDNGTGMDCDLGGKFGSGCDFDGTDDYVLIGDEAELKINTRLSLFAWISADANDGTVLYGGHEDGNYNTYALATDGSGNLTFKFRNSGGTAWHGFTSSSSYTWTDGWHHVGVTHVYGDPDSTVFYRDGEPVTGTWTTGDGTELPWVGVNRNSIGERGRDTGISDSFDGSIDDARIYNRVLSSKEVKSLYNWAPGPIAHYQMDQKVSGDAQTIPDVSGSGFNATTHYGADTAGMDCTVQGKYGGACDFDGVDDYASSTISPNPGGTFHFSMALWVKTSQTSNKTLATRVGSSPGLQNINGTPRFRLIPKDYPTDPILSVDGSTAIDDGEWHHMVGVWDGSTKQARIYIDGVLENTGTATTSEETSSSSGTFHFGGYMNGSSYPDAVIDDFQVFNYDLTEKQIRNIMNGRTVNANAIGSPVGSPTAHWSFDEGYGDTAYEDGGNYDGDLGGSGEDCSDGGTGCPTWSSDGKYGKALEFNGSDSYVEGTGFISNFFQSGSYTVSVWFNQATLGSDGLVGYAADAYPPMNLATRGASGVRYEVRDDSDTQLMLIDGGSYAVDEWNQALVTFDADTNTANLYVNGEKVGTDTLSGTPATTAKPLTIGDSYWNDALDGLIDEVKIYNYALTQEEVNLEFNQGKAVVFGSLSTESDGSTPSNSGGREYCVPGDTSTCNPPVFDMNFDQDKVTGDAQTIRDVSGKGNDGTTDNGGNGTGMACNVQGIKGNACDFDGVDDDINITDNAALDVTSAITISAWVYHTANASDEMILSKWANSHNSYFFGTDWLSTDELRLGLDQNGAFGSMYDVYSTTANLTPQKWQHVAVTWNTANDEAWFYVDGIRHVASVHSGSSPTGIYSGSGDVAIGATDEGTSGWWDGKIDQVRMYDYVRTPAQIVWEYNKGAPIAHYKFDECEGTTIKDWSKNAQGESNGNHGTLTIGATGTNTSAGTCSSGTGTEAWNNGTTGYFKSAMDFDGTNDYVTATISNQSSFPTATIAAWIYIDASTGTWQVPLTLGSNPTMNIACENSDNQKCGCDLYNAATNPVDIGYDTWTHIACVKDGTNMIQYINGKYTSTEATSTTLDNAVSIGRGRISQYYTNGMVDDVRIYNYPLSEAQIKTVVNEGSAVRFD